MKEISISTAYVTLGQFLKLANLIQSGGEAKAFLAVNLVMVQGTPENRRGKKLVAGDVVSVRDQEYVIVRS